MGATISLNAKVSKVLGGRATPDTLPPLVVTKAKCTSFVDNMVMWEWGASTFARSKDGVVERFAPMSREDALRLIDMLGLELQVSNEHGRIWEAKGHPCKRLYNELKNNL